MKKRKSSKTSIIIGASVGAVLVLAVAGVAIASKGFQNFKPITDAVKGGTVVETLEANALADGVVTFANGDADVVASFGMSHGSFAVPEGAAATAEEILTLGDETTADLAKADLESDLKGNLGMSNAKVASIESQVLSLDLGKVSTLESYVSIDWTVAENEEPGVGQYKVAYFDSVRVNYKLSGSRYLISSVSDDESPVGNITYEASKEINTITSDWRDISLLPEDEELGNIPSWISLRDFSLSGADNNEMVIESIELVCKTKAEHPDYVFLSTAASAI